MTMSLNENESWNQQKNVVFSTKFSSQKLIFVYIVDSLEETKVGIFKSMPVESK